MDDLSEKRSSIRPAQYTVILSYIQSDVISYLNPPLTPPSYLFVAQRAEHEVHFKLARSHPREHSVRRRRLKVNLCRARAKEVSKKGKKERKRVKYRGANN
jgi:hypothetical protein